MAPKKRRHETSTSKTTRVSRKAKGKRGTWSEEAMGEAVSAVRLKKMGFNAAVKQFGVPRATLKRHIDGTNRYAKDGKKSFGRSCDLPSEIESELVRHILMMEERFYGLNR